MNETSPNPQDQLWLTGLLYIVYMIEGSIISVGNFLIVLAIARYEALRNNKEYNILCGLSFADGLNMAGFFCSGLYRIILLIVDQHNAMKSAWECLLMPHNILQSVALKPAGIMLMVVSSDRLLAVLFPLQYLGWTASYARRFIAAAYTFELAHLSYFHYSVYTNNVLVPAACSLVDVLRATTNPLYVNFFMITSALHPLLSVVMYLIVMLLLYKRSHSMVFPEHPNQQYELKRQRRTTVTLSISALCTFFLFVVPASISLSLLSAGYWHAGLLFACVCHTNSMANIFIYPLRHKEVKQAMEALLKGKHMPVDLKMWTPGASQMAAKAGPSHASQAMVKDPRSLQSRRKTDTGHK